MAPDDHRAHHVDEADLLPALPAATLVVYHDDGSTAPPRLLMVRRAETMAFAAGMAVFPGGRVDADDGALAAGHAERLGLSIEDAAARVAAIRETLEETGLAVGISGVDAAGLRAMREGLLADALFSGLIAQSGAALDLGALAPFSRWRPNFAHSRIFDTRFYIASVAGPLPELSIVERENSALFWTDAASALAMADAGDIAVIFPTRRNLERLTQYVNYAELLASTRRFPAHRITPFVIIENGQRFLCIRDDCDYPVTREPYDSALRG